MALPALHKVFKPRSDGAWALYIYAYRGGQQIGAFYGATRTAALAAAGAAAADLAAAYADARRPAIPPGTLQAVLAAYRGSPEWAALAAATQETYSAHLARLPPALEALTARQLTADLGAKAVRAWRDALAVKHSPRQADAAIVALSAALRYGRQARLLPRDCQPTQGLGRLYQPGEQHRWTHEELAHARACLPDHLVWAIDLALDTGLRRADLVSLPWTAIQADRGQVEWRPSRGRRRRRLVHIALTASLSATLAHIPRRAITILTSSRGTPWTPDGLSASIDTHLREAGLPGRLHSLRRAAARRLYDQGLSALQIATQLGWREREAEVEIRRYAGL